MSRPAIVPSSQADLRRYPSLVTGAKPIVANAGTQFVLVNEVAWSTMKKRLREFCAEFEQQVRSLFLSPASEVAPRSSMARSRKSEEQAVRRNLDAPYILKIRGVRVWDDGRAVPYFAFTYIERVNAAIQAIRTRNRSFPNVNGVQLLDRPFGQQRVVAEEMLDDESIRTMSIAKEEWAFENCATQKLMDAARGCDSTLAFLELILAPVLDWMTKEETFRKSGRHRSMRKVKSKKRPLVNAWFALWLAERQIVFFPPVVGRYISDMTPRFWRSLRHAFIPKDTKEYWTSLEFSVGQVANLKSFSNEDKSIRREGVLEHVRGVTSVMRLTSTWRGHDQVSADFMRHLFPHVHRAYQFYLRVMWDNHKSKCVQLSPDRVRDEEAKLRHLKARPRAGPLAGRVWPWVDDPDYTSYQNTERYSLAGVRAGPNLLSHVSELRELLPRIVGKSVYTWTSSLAVWLQYLVSLPDADVPPRLLDIVRVKHIDSPNDPTAQTLCNFERQADLPKTLRPRVYYHLEAAWNAAYLLAAADHRPSSSVSPVLVRFDAPKSQSSARGQTHRRPLDEEILQFVIAENRRDDFKFSQSRRHGGERRHADYRRVVDAQTGQSAYVWFPGPAVLMDLLLNIPLRKKQGRYLDSGEGDEFILDIETLELRINPRPTAEKGRQEAFLCRRSISLLEEKPVLAMFVNTNKTGRQYSVPWLPLDVARNVQHVIDWQQRFNHIREPVADRDYSSSDRGGTDMFDEDVWPIFRDADDPGNQPLSDGKLQSYFVALMEHCEKEFNAKSGRDISLFTVERGPSGREIRKPIIDLHSLRVTGVTVLIENGVPLEVVQQLVGHASIAMTCYYHVLESSKVHESLMRAMESRVMTVERLLKMSPDEFKEFSDRFVFNRSGEPSLALEMVTAAIRQRNPGWDMKFHGMCAGGDCRFGGPLNKDGEPTPLWRAEACSLCRYRITGVPWLVGLVHHLNVLWFELRDCTRSVVELQMRRDSAEDMGASVGGISGELERVKIRRDNLVHEWANELRYVEQGKRDLDEWIRWTDEKAAQGADKGLGQSIIPLRSPLGESGVKVQLSKVHELSHLTELMRGARILSSAILPRGIKEDRNALVLEIARASGEDGPFLKLKRKDAERAFDALADLILDHVSEPDELEELVESRVTLERYPEIKQRVAALLACDSSSASPLDLIPARLEGRDGNVDGGEHIGPLAP